MCRPTAKQRARVDGVRCLLHNLHRGDRVHRKEPFTVKRAPIREAWEVSTAEQRIRELGGIATTGELIALGYYPQHLLVLAAFGRIVRIRKGWYASTDVDEAVIQARRVGGVLACMSALAHHGWCEPEPSVLHVRVPRSASRLRSPQGPALSQTVRDRGE